MSEEPRTGLRNPLIERAFQRGRQQALAEVRAIHKPEPFTDYVAIPPQSYDICLECSDEGGTGYIVPWPCRTVAVIDRLSEEA